MQPNTAQPREPVLAALRHANEMRAKRRGTYEPAADAHLTPLDERGTYQPGVSLDWGKVMALSCLGLSGLLGLAMFIGIVGALATAR